MAAASSIGDAIPTGGGGGGGSGGGDDAEHRVWLGRVPASLCVSEELLRKTLGVYGDIEDVTIHHDFTDMAVEGFAFLTFRHASDAQRLLDAVAMGQIDGYPMLAARAAFHRGPPAPREPGTLDMAELLLGHRQAAQANPFSQRSFLAGLDGAEEDDEDLMLQSLSQRSLRTPTKVKKKKAKKRSRHD